MGLLNSKSSTNLYFHVSNNEISYYYFGHLLRCYLKDDALEYLGINEKDKDYPVELFINADLSKLSGYNARNIRSILHKSNLVNEYDRQYLNSINFKEEDFNVNIFSLSIPPEGEFNINRILAREGYSYLFQLVLDSKEELLAVPQIGPKRVGYVEKTLNQYGYPLRTNEVLSKEEDKQVDPVIYEENGARVIMTRRTFIALCEELVGLSQDINHLNELINKINTSEEETSEETKHRK